MHDQMAKVTKLSVTVSRKVTDNKYGSVDTSVTEEVVLESGDDPEKEFSRLRSRVIDKCSDSIKRASSKLIKE
jgi:hypothetical protein